MKFLSRERWFLLLSQIIGPSQFIGFFLTIGTTHLFAAQDPKPPSSREISREQLEFFESKVRPILVERCYECHAGKESNGGLRLDYRDGLRLGGDSGPAIDTGDYQASRVLIAIQYDKPELQMPPSGKLPPAEIQILDQWIRAGAPDPRVQIPELASDKPTGMSIEAGRDFWSIRPLAAPKIPRTQHPEWCRNPIDAFILSRLEEKELLPAPAANKREILRRLSLNLIGIPPTPDELLEFEQNDAPESVDLAIDRLLSSPQYGVRFGRHWLDVARYADSNGLDENIAYGNAWRYRDYVVESFNTDKPFDRFVEEQIAGDLLPDANRESKTATGYLVLGAKVLAEPDRDKLTMDTIDEQIDALGKTFLGLTLGCARCHDHKFDPIKQRDYYALAAIFKGTKTFGDSNYGAIKHWNEISFANDEERGRLKSVDADIAAKNSAWTSIKNEAMQRLRDQVKRQAVDYLVVAAKHTSEATLNDWAAAGSEFQLHPRVLANCRRHLDYHKDDPLFATWHKLASTGDLEGIRNHYASLFERTQAEWEKGKTANPPLKKLEDPELEAARLAIAEPGGFLAIPAKMEHALDDETIAKIHQLAEVARIFESAAPDETAVMGVGDKGIVEGLPIHIRGSYRNLGTFVERGFPEVLDGHGSRAIFNSRSSGRLELARWMTHPSHPLTARVIVNRVWRWHFGRGLVPSTDNFGALGDHPSHPELLDYLARWLIQSGWSIKELNRLIVSSTTYQMANEHHDSDKALAVDPENTLRWRFVPQRLDAEQIRDSILAASGRLDLTLGGKSVPLRNRQFVFDHTSIDHTKYDSPRRSIYLPIIRNHLFSLFEQFDYPDPTMPVGDRHTTTVSPQMLLLMNAPWILESADSLAKQSEQHASAPDRRIEWLFQQTLGREPSPTEQLRATDFISKDLTNAASDPNIPDLKTRWTLLAHNLLICNEAMYVP